MILDNVKDSLSLSLSLLEGGGGGGGKKYPHVPSQRKVGGVCRACQISHTYQITGYSHLQQLESQFNAKKPKQIK